MCGIQKCSVKALIPGIERSLCSSFYPLCAFLFPFLGTGPLSVGSSASATMRCNGNLSQLESASGVSVQAGEHSANRTPWFMATVKMEMTSFIRSDNRPLLCLETVSMTDTDCADCVYCQEGWSPTRDGTRSSPMPSFHNHM